MKYLLVVATGLLLVLPSLAQRNIPQFIRLSEDNDALNVRGRGTDWEYTNGTRVEVYYTKNTRPRFPSTILISLGRAVHIQDVYGAGLTHLMYTPWDLTREDITRESRPYTGVLYATHSLVSADPVRHQKLTTAIGLGVLGRMALGKELQKWMHQVIHSGTPQGWDHQLPTDVLINYLIRYEKLLVQPSPNVQLLGAIGTNLGTLCNHINAGITFRAGIFGDYFTDYPLPSAGRHPSQGTVSHKCQFYFFIHPQGRLVVHDAVLQGGFFTGRRADHTMGRDLLKRGFGQLEYGAVFSYHRLGISVSETLLTAQYEGAPSQQVGNLTLFVGL